MKVALAVVAAVLLVLAGGAGGYLLGDDESDSGSPERASLPAGWSLCANAARGFAIGYPRYWHTDEVAAEETCEFFDPDPFEIPRQSDFSGTALEIRPGGDSFDSVVSSLTDPMFARVLSRDFTTVAGRAAVRLETEATGKGFEGKGVKVIAYVVDRGRTGFAVSTTGFPGKGDYASRKATLDQAISTLRFFTPTATALAHGQILSRQEGLPEAVARTRLGIAKAAAARNYSVLMRLIPDDGFEYTFGVPSRPGAVKYWRRLEVTTDERPFESLVSILSLPYTKVNELYVWPFAFDRNPRTLSPEELELLSTYASPAEIRTWRRFGSYFGWRAAIEPDGDWVLYVAGD